MLKQTIISCLPYIATKLCESLNKNILHTLFMFGQLETLEFTSTQGCLTAG